MISVLTLARRGSVHHLEKAGEKRANLDAVSAIDFGTVTFLFRKTTQSTITVWQSQVGMASDVAEGPLHTNPILSPCILQ